MYLATSVNDNIYVDHVSVGPSPTSAALRAVPLPIEAQLCINCLQSKSECSKARFTVESRDRAVDHTARKQVPGSTRIDLRGLCGFN